MKRDPNLYPLSRQHHNGLMVVLLLKKGIQKAADPAVMSDFILTAWKDELEGHFQAEEQTFPFNSVHSRLNELYQHMLHEHHLIRNIVAAIKRGDANVVLIRDFLEALEKHIRFEERIYFPAIEAILTQDALQDLGKKLEQLAPVSCVNYPVKFWE